MRSVGLVLLVVACGGGDKADSSGGGTVPAKDSGGRSSPMDSDGSGDDGSTGDSGGENLPRWLSWEGEETLSVDVLADGAVECVFHWRTSGLHRPALCEGCEFEFDVVGVVDDATSTCVGAAGFQHHRWWMNASLYSEDGRTAAGELDDGGFTARAYTMDLDPTYGAPVAMTWELRVTLR